MRAPYREVIAPAQFEEEQNVEFPHENENCSGVYCLEVSVYYYCWEDGAWKENWQGHKFSKVSDIMFEDVAVPCHQLTLLLIGALCAPVVANAE